MAITAEDPTHRRRRARAGRDHVHPHPQGGIEPGGGQLAEPLRECRNLAKAHKSATMDTKIFH